MFKTFPVSSAGAVTSELVSAFEVSGVVALSLLSLLPQPANIVATIVAHSSALTTFFFI